VTGEWRKLHYLYSSQIIIRIMKARWVRLAGHIARMEEKRNVYMLWENQREGGH
jgi:hypothetical protein